MKELEDTGVLKSVLRLTFWLYVLVIFTSGFGNGSHEIPVYTLGAVIELVALWVVPCLVFVVYLVRQPVNRATLWREWRLMVIGSGVILLVGVIHKTILIVFGVMLSQDEIVLFPYQQSSEKQLFAVIAMASFVLKYLGLTLCLAALIRKAGIESIKSDRRLSILLSVAVICVALVVSGEVKRILAYFN